MATKFLYVLACDLNRIKIGISADAHERMKQIQASSPIKVTLRLAYAQELTPNDARAFEGRLHRQFAAYRLHGEWFSISVQEAIEAAEAMCIEAQALPPRTVERKSSTRYFSGVSLARTGH